ncbi:choice-of-anchor L domain-containing protein, partial [Flavobacterium urocaniciphilum]
MKKLLLLCIMLFSLITNAQLNVNNTLYSPADLILSKLIGPGLAVSNVKYNNSAANAFVTNNQLGFYSTGSTATNLGLTSGLIMTNGSATGAIGPNSANGSTTASNTPMNGDPDLSLITTMSINNICILEFDFVPLGPEVKFEYVFASEEYPEYVNSSFNDVFGFFLSGPGISGPFSNGAKNIALLPNSTTPISINNVNCGNASGCPATLPGNTNCAYYVNNCGGAHIQYDGFTTVLTARSEVQCGQTYHIKLALADAGDSAFDSAVFFKEKSFSVPSVNLGGDMVGPSEACCGDSLPFTTPFNQTDYPGAIHYWYFNNVLVYTSTTSNTYILSDLTCTDGIMKVIVKPYPSQNCTFEDEIVINYKEGPVLNTPNPLTLCSDNPATATGVFDLNLQINAIVPNYDSSFDELGFYLTYDDAFDDTNVIPQSQWHTFNGTNDQSIFLGYSNFMTSGNVCRSIKEFKLKFVNCDDTVCSLTPNSTLFDLTTRKPIIFNGFDPTKYSISFHHDMASAVAGTGAITPENAYVTSTNPEEIYVRYWENLVPLNKQFTQFTLQASQSNYAGTDGTLTFCKDDVVVYNLADYITGEQTGGTWSIVSGSGANVNLAAGTIASNNSAANYVLQYTVNASPTCPTDVSTVTVTINAVCGAQTPPNMVLCDNLNDGVEIFNLSLQNAAILGTLSSADYTVSYHTSAANATSGAAPITPNNAYPNISNPQTIYIRVIKNSDGSLFDDSKFFDLIVVAPPTVTSFTGTASICNGSSTNLTFVGTPNTIVTYSDGTSTLTTPLDATGNGSVTVTPTATTTYTLSGIATTGTPVCTNTATGSVTITVNNPPVAGTDGSTTVCETSAAVIDLYSLITGEQA